MIVTLIITGVVATTVATTVAVDVVTIPSVVAIGAVAAAVTATIAVDVISIPSVVATTITVMSVPALDQLTEACDLLARKDRFDALLQGGDALGFGCLEGAMKLVDGGAIRVNCLVHEPAGFGTGYRPLGRSIANACCGCAKGLVVALACGACAAPCGLDAGTVLFVAVRDCRMLTLGELHRGQSAMEYRSGVVTCVIGASFSAADRMIARASVRANVCVTIADRCVQDLLGFLSVKPELTNVELYLGGDVTGNDVKLLEREAACAVGLDREVVTPDRQSGEDRCSQEGCEISSVHGHLLLGRRPENLGKKGFLTCASMLCCVWDTMSHGRLRSPVIFFRPDGNPGESGLPPV